MGWRIRQSVRLGSGIRANLSKSGVSYSFGGRGYTVTVGHGKIRRTVSIPGTSFSHVSSTRYGSSDSTLVWLIQFLPLLILAAFVLHWIYEPMKKMDWDPLAIIGVLIFTSIAAVAALGWLAKQIPQGLVMFIGACLYGGSVVYGKLTNELKMEPTGATIFAIIAAAIGAWSFGSCHSALCAAASKHGKMPSADFIDENSDESREEAESSFESEVKFDPRKMEHRVAISLRDLGWNSQIAADTGNHGIDVIAEMREKIVVIRCIPSLTLVDADVIHEAYAAQIAEQAHHAAVVSGVGFTRDANRVGEATRVVLLHPDHLQDLEFQLFATETWKDLPSPDEIHRG